MHVRANVNILKGRAWGTKLQNVHTAGPFSTMYSWDGQENFPSENAILELDLKSPYLG